MFVYIITNRLNGKKYVGQHSGTDLEKYLNSNLNRALNGGNEKRALYSAVRKYGRENFDIKPLVIVATKEEVSYYEIELIKVLNTKSPKGYNLTDGGEGLLNPSEETRKILSAIFTGRVFSDETRKKMSDIKIRDLKIKPRVITQELRDNISKSLSGRKLSEDHVRQIRERRLGSKSSLETKAKVSRSLLGNKRTSGHILTEEHKRKMSEGLLGHPTSEETRKKISDSQKGKPKRSSHKRWHTDRNVLNPNCVFCLEAQNVAATDATSPS